MTLPTAAPLSALRRVHSPRATRKLAAWLSIVFVVLPIILVLAPWQQNVAGKGRVTALHPLDRTQVIPAPVTGPLIELLVQEGQWVEEGTLLARMQDQDPDFTSRLETQVSLEEIKVKASKDRVEFYDQQLIFAEDAREQAIDEATFELQGAMDEVESALQDLKSAEADYDQKRRDRERKWRLLEGQTSSRLEYEKADAAATMADAKVASMKAKIEQARNNEKAKMANVSGVSNAERAKLESIKTSREKARSEAALAEKELADAETKLERQRTQTVYALRSGTILRIHAATNSDLLKQGDPLIELIPDTDELAVEVWARGVDAPLLKKGGKVRLQFEGWPAVQFVGWPSIAVGTFGGIVSVIDAQGTAGGLFRVLVLPDPDDKAWPDRRYLRQGVRVKAWFLLRQVTLGFELWRQLNAFPPTVEKPPTADGKGGDGKSDRP